MTGNKLKLTKLINDVMEEIKKNQKSNLTFMKYENALSNIEDDEDYLIDSNDMQVTFLKGLDLTLEDE